MSVVLRRTVVGNGDWRFEAQESLTNLWISSLSNLFFAIAKLTTTFSQKPSLCPGKKLHLLESLVANWHVYWHVPPFLLYQCALIRLDCSFISSFSPFLTADFFSWQFLRQCCRQSFDVYLKRTEKTVERKCHLWIFPGQNEQPRNRRRKTWRWDHSFEGTV